MITFHENEIGFGEKEVYGSGSGYVQFYVNDEKITLDGRFTLNDLERIVQKVKEYRELVFVCPKCKSTVHYFLEDGPHCYFCETL